MAPKRKIDETEEEVGTHSSTTTTTTTTTSSSSLTGSKKASAIKQLVVKKEEGDATREPSRKKARTSTTSAAVDAAPATDAVREAILSMKTVANMKDLLPYSHPESWYTKGQRVVVFDKMQKDYEYVLEENLGQNFDADFRPVFTPRQMLSMGVFEGKYLNDCMLELPREWYEDGLAAGKLSPSAARPSINFLGIKSRQNLDKWVGNGWIPITKGCKDVRGWFQWYCRYYVGRRQPGVDRIQIGRWKAFVRHQGQILASYQREGPKVSEAAKRGHRTRQRQGLLQWSYNPLI